MRERQTRDCVSCGARCSCAWVIDAWVCSRVRCQAEFYPTPHDPNDHYDQPKSGMEPYTRCDCPEPEDDCATP